MFACLICIFIKSVYKTQGQDEETFKRNVQESRSKNNTGAKCDLFSKQLLLSMYIKQCMATTMLRRVPGYLINWSTLLFEPSMVSVYLTSSKLMSH